MGWMYSLRTIVCVQLAFITTVLYWGPVMHSVWKSPALFALHVVCYAVLAWSHVLALWVLACAALSALWLYVTLVSMYFLDEAASLHALAQPVLESTPLGHRAFRF